MQMHPDFSRKIGRINLLSLAVSGGKPAKGRLENTKQSPNGLQTGGNTQ
jgi:hypothetical protein